jgi:NADH-quinone oxidoreductase subunit M
MTIPWLTILALFPAVGAVALIFTGVKAAKQIALVVALITLVFAVIVATQFKIGDGMQLVEQVPWIKPLGAYYALGLDGLGLTLVLLVVIITPVVIIARFRSDRCAP